MASVVTPQYLFDTFYSVSTQQTQLEEETIEKINYLATKVGAPTYKKTPDFRRTNKNKTDNGYKRKQTRSSTPTTVEDWEAVRNFKTTKLEKTTEGIGVDIDKTRSYLNRLTKKTYNDVLENILRILDLIVNDKSNDTDMQENILRVGNAIFEIGSKNKFWSELYAILYKDLVNKNPFMKNICQKNFEEFKDMFTAIEYISPEEDYDKYCIINKKNEERKGMSNFLTYLMKNDLIDTDSMVDLIIDLLKIVETYINMENKQKHVEEISENLSLLILNGLSSLKTANKWTIINDKVEQLSVMKARDYKSLSQKTVFKMMDILDEL